MVKEESVGRGMAWVPSTAPPQGSAAPWSGHVDRRLNETQREVLSQGHLEGSPAWELN